MQPRLFAIANDITRARSAPTAFSRGQRHNFLMAQVRRGDREFEPINPFAKVLSQRRDRELTAHRAMLNGMIMLPGFGKTASELQERRKLAAKTDFSARAAFYEASRIYAEVARDPQAFANLNISEASLLSSGMKPSSARQAAQKARMTITSSGENLGFATAEAVQKALREVGGTALFTDRVEENKRKQKKAIV